MNVDEVAWTQTEVSDKPVQVNMKQYFRSKATNTYTPKLVTRATSPIESLRPQSPYQESDEYSSSSDEAFEDPLGDSDYIAESDESFDGETVEKDAFQNMILQTSMMAITKKPRLCLGVPDHMMNVVFTVCEKTQLEKINVCVTLKKIRLDESNAILALQFGLSESQVSRIFKKSLKPIAYCMQQHIVWPDALTIRAKLPISFRARYAKVQAIIDCLEIQIEKPANPIKQSLSWSQYKKCNTMKYLVACTPHGLFNYISAGYGGRTSDKMIIENCGFLEYVKPGMEVMADRGFKNIAHIVLAKGGNLIRPPTVSKDVPLSREEVSEAKRIAALRIHVERAISRIREFKMLHMHACIDNKYICDLDFIIMIASGLINLQDSLIK
jgi:hypothetical protein